MRVRWLVTGARGLLGRDVVKGLRASGDEVTAVGRRELDIIDGPAVASAVRGHDVVVNCAGWTAVDAAEEAEVEAFLANALGPAKLARACRREGARLVQLSTDYVFDGRSAVPYAAEAPVAPLGAYGRTKTAGEWAVRAEHPAGSIVVRTAWLYGAGGPCFPRTIARAAAERGSVSVVTDQLGQPTWTADVAEVVEALVRVGAPPGTYHATSSGTASWFDLAQEVCEAAGFGAGAVQPTTSEAFVRPAPRPAYSVLDHGSLVAAGVAPIGDWRERWRAAAAEVLG